MNGEALTELGSHIGSSLGPVVGEIEVSLGELMFRVEPASVVRVMTWLRDDPRCQFTQLVDLCGVDYPERPKRLEVVYNLLSLTQNKRVRVKTSTDEDTPVPSIASVFRTANWFEREAWDLYGIFFSDHPDLRRILTDYGFEGHPMRKDFPLTGFVECRYDTEQRRVVYEPVRLTQDWRNWDFLSPWEGMTDVQLPGDEKAVRPKDGSPR